VRARPDGVPPSMLAHRAIERQLARPKSCTSAIASCRSRRDTYELRTVRVIRAAPRAGNRHRPVVSVATAGLFGFGSAPIRVVVREQRASRVGASAEVAAAFEVVESEAVFEFAVVVFAAPADLRQPDEFSRWRVGGQVRQPVVGGFGSPGWPFGNQPALGWRAVGVWRVPRLAGRTRGAGIGRSSPQSGSQQPCGCRGAR
jgi:hypothetical protein